MNAQSRPTQTVITIIKVIIQFYLSVYFSLETIKELILKYL